MKRSIAVIGALAALGLVLWTTGVSRPRAAAPPPAAPVQGKLLSEMGAAPAKAGSSLVAPRATPYLPGKIDVNSLPDVPKKIDTIPVVMDGTFRKVTLYQLASWDYDVPKIPREGEPPKDLGSLAKFPPPIRELNETSISLEGFMIPVEVDRDRVKSFVLVTSPLVCCYGQVPKLNEWAMVTMADGRSAPIMMDIPITVRGKLAVGEEVKNRSIISLYRLSAQEVEGPRDL